MGYSARGGSGYNTRSKRGVGGKKFSGKSVAEVQASRSFQSLLMDSSRKAPIAKSVEDWVNQPNRLDLAGVDTPHVALKKADKQPWEMTYSEFYDVAGSEYSAGERFGVTTVNRVPGFFKEIKGEGLKLVGEIGATPEERIHRAVIRKALSEGRSVPEEVLKQYPDLKETYVVTNTRYGGVKEVKAVSPEQAVAKAVKDAGVPSPFVADLVAEKKVVVPISKGSVEGATATFNKATGWMAINFSSIPSFEIRQEMKSKGFRYNPVRKQWIAKSYPFREDLAKKYAGSIEEVNIEPNWAAKAEKAKVLSEKHEEESDRRYEERRKIMDNIPFGQPILVGHHSEKAHRSDLDKAEKHFEKSIEEHKIAEKYAKKAESYAEKAKGESPSLIYRRIKKLEAEERKFKRLLEEADLADKIAAKNPNFLNKYYLNRDREWPNQNLPRIQQRLEVERQKYKSSGGLPFEKMKLKRGDRVVTRFGLGTIASVSRRTARIKLDPFDTGRERNIYANDKGESLLSIDDIKDKLT